MRIFKPQYKDKQGRVRTVPKWWIELRDHKHKVRRFAGFPGDAEAKKLTEDYGRQIERLVNIRAAGERPDARVRLWLAEIPKKLSARLAEVGLLDAKTIQVGKPLVDYLPDFQDTVKGCPKHVRLTARRVRIIIEACAFNLWSDVTDRAVNTYIKERIEEGLSKQTAQFYVATFRRFCRWMVKYSGADQAPELNTVSFPKNYRRHFELDEFTRLLESARTGSVRFGLTGYQRYLVYLLAVETGLRRGEICSLTPASFDLTNNCVFVKAEDTKSKRDAHQYLTDETANLLKEYIRGKMLGVQLFDLPEKTAIMIRNDCEDGGIEVENHKGRLTFHGLRHSCGSFLAHQGVRPKEIQTIMRHTNINLTMSRYTHLLSGDERAAVNKLPKFAKPKTKEKTA